MRSHREVSKEIPQISRTECEQYIVLPAPSPVPNTASASCLVGSILHCYCFFVRRPRFTCNVWRAFNLLGHILTHEHLNMSNETLRHLAIMYVNKMAKKCKYEEEQ